SKEAIFRTFLALFGAVPLTHSDHFGGRFLPTNPCGANGTVNDAKGLPIVNRLNGRPDQNTMLRCSKTLDNFVRCNIFRPFRRKRPENMGKIGHIARRGCRERGHAMVKNFDEMQQFGKDNLDASMKSIGAFSKSAQAIAVELADYSKKMFEQGTAAT